MRRFEPNLDRFVAWLVVIDHVISSTALNMLVVPAAYYSAHVRRTTPPLVRGAERNG